MSSRDDHAPKVPEKFNLIAFVGDTRIARYLQDIINTAYREGYANGKAAAYLNVE